MITQFSSDEELLMAVQNDDREAFNFLYERYWSLVYKKSFSYLRNEVACSEIVNDIFLNIWLKRNVLNIQTFKAYLTSSARYRVYNFLRVKKHCHLVYVEDYESLLEANVESNEGDIGFGTQEINGKVEYLLNQLPKRCKEIYLLSREEQISNAEIAARLSISKRTVENQLSLAIKHLKKHLVTLVALQQLLQQHLKN